MKAKKLIFILLLTFFSVLLFGCKESPKPLNKVKFELDGGNWTETRFNEEFEVADNTILNEPKNPTKSGFKFDGWRLINKNNVEDNVKFIFSFYKVNQSITLKAKWIQE